MLGISVLWCRLMFSFSYFCFYIDRHSSQMCTILPFSSNGLSKSLSWTPQYLHASLSLTLFMCLQNLLRTYPQVQTSSAISSMVLSVPRCLASRAECGIGTTFNIYGVFLGVKPVGTSPPQYFPSRDLSLRGLSLFAQSDQRGERASLSSNPHVDPIQRINWQQKNAPAFINLIMNTGAFLTGLLYFSVA